jgi:outer membrane biosynthesis protein TonB
MNNLNLRARLYALVLLALIFAVSGERASSRVYAQHEGHDMGNMPGMNKQKPEAKPQRKRPASQKKEEPAEPAGHDMHDMNTSTPSPATSPEPEASPAAEESGAPETPAPEASPTPSQGTVPVVTDSLPAIDHSIHDTSQPKLSQPHKPAQGTEHTDIGGPENKVQPIETKDSMGGMDMSGMKHPSGTGTMDTDSLMVMSGEQMDIRVGSNKRNAIPMGQMGSGTSWQPSTTPMYMWFKRASGWLLFFHGDMKLGVNSQGGPRGVTKAESSNWFMPMAFRQVGQGTLQLRGMLSFEPFTFARGGSPLLFQTGETYRGQPLVDKQHPHDLFMELSGTYTVPVGERGTWFAYLGFPGEPALGPTAFMHRWSASENPSAPLSHHLQDSTHISFGVFTTGFTYRWLKLEGSLFNGREPDENRYNFEFNPWNSRSVRLSFAPNRNWAMQWSYGLLKNPEALEPGDVRRMTASVSYNRRFHRGNWASSLIWGRNREEHAGELFHLNGYTAESTVQFLDKNYLYTRLELVDKKDLLGDEDRLRLGIEEHHPQFRIGAYTFGAARDVWDTEKISVAVGGDFTLYSKPHALDEIYGSNPTSYRFFIRLRPSRMGMSAHVGH